MFHCIEYVFLSFRIFEQLALSLESRVALEFLTVLKYFLSFRSFEQLALALKTEFALKVFKPGGEAAPDPPPRTPMVRSVKLCRVNVVRVTSSRWFASSSQCRVT